MEELIVELTVALEYIKTKAEYGYKVRLPADCCVDIFCMAKSALDKIKQK